MAWIKIIEEDNANDSVAELYAKMQDPRTGRVDNIMKVHSLHPRGMAGHFSLYTAVMRGTETLPQADREMIALVVSLLNSCHY
ncbi:MAG: carboxymuconolactone decarboxylase family protein [Actinomycetota bacterium]|nr:carboxymuconolactone decarboxylase family protein [Actinomycetota bacterium]